MEHDQNCKPSVAKTIRHEVVHLVIAVSLSLLFYLYSSDIWLVLWVFGVCMFLDADHLFDYGLYILKTKKKFSLREFLSGEYFAEWKNFITPLHSWEMVILFALLYLFIPNNFLIGTSFALAAHYFVDYFTNSVNKMAYFILYRASYDFKKIAIRKDFNE
jgi:hypothetical protein